MHLLELNTRVEQAFVWEHMDVVLRPGMEDLQQPWSELVQNLRDVQEVFVKEEASRFVAQGVAAVHTTHGKRVVNMQFEHKGHEIRLKLIKAAKTIYVNDTHAIKLDEVDFSEGLLETAIIRAYLYLFG